MSIQCAHVSHTREEVRFWNLKNVDYLDRFVIAVFTAAATFAGFRHEVTMETADDSTAATATTQNTTETPSTVVTECGT